MLQGALQLLDALVEEVAQRPPERRVPAGAQRAGGVRVDDDGTQVGVDEDDPARRVVEERLAEGYRALQVDLGVHLGERAVDPRGAPVGAVHGGGLGPHQHPAAVLGQQRELVDLAAVRGHGAQQPLAHLLGVGGARGPAGETAPADGLLGRPAQDAGGLGVPVRDHSVAVQGTESGLHAVEERGEQLRRRIK